MRNMTITGNPPPAYRQDSIEMRFIDRSISTSYDDEQGIRDRIDHLKKQRIAIPCLWCDGSRAKFEADMAASNEGKAL